MEAEEKLLLASRAQSCYAGLLQLNTLHAEHLTLQHRNPTESRPMLHRLRHMQLATIASLQQGLHGCHNMVADHAGGCAPSMNMLLL